MILCFKFSNAGDAKNSHVSASWEDEDSFDATIKLHDETYVIEPSWRHLPPDDNYTMIVYKGSDMKMSVSQSKTIIVLFRS